MKPAFGFPDYTTCDFFVLFMPNNSLSYWMLEHELLHESA